MDSGRAIDTTLPPSSSQMQTLHGSSSPMPSCFKRLVCQLWIACAEYHVSAKLAIELGFQRRLDVDFGEHAESLFLQRIRRSGSRILERYATQMRGIAIRRIWFIAQLHDDSLCLSSTIVSRGQRV